MCNIDKIYIECKLCFQKLLLLEQHLIALSKNFFPVSIVLYPECMNVQDIGDTFKICAYHMHTVYALSFSRVTFTAHVSHLRFKKWGFSTSRESSGEERSGGPAYIYLPLSRVKSGCPPKRCLFILSKNEY